MRKGWIDVTMRVIGLVVDLSSSGWCWVVAEAQGVIRLYWVNRREQAKAS